MSSVQDERGSLVEKPFEATSIDVASQFSASLGKVILAAQAALLVVLFLFFNYDSTEDYSTQKYIVFRDIMVMLLLGFGYCKWTEKKARILIFDMSSLT
jgi:hypothetical protein